ncbi:MAG: pyridoxamine 5'-phosphate oxidase family protein [Anaerolineae bacterium]
MDTYAEAIEVMTKQFGHDVAVSLATVSGNRPNVRTVNAYFAEDAFYITTYGLSSKMREIAVNPQVAICHNLFVAHGTGTNLGSPVAEQNSALRAVLHEVFCAFYDRHVNEADPNTCILKVTLTDAAVFTHDAKYLVDLTAHTAEKQAFVNDIIL